MNAIARVFETLIEGIVAVIVVGLTLAFVASPLILIAWIAWVSSN